MSEMDRLSGLIRKLCGPMSRVRWVWVASALLLAAWVTIALVACSSPEAGYVTRKDYSPSWIEFRSQCNSYNSKTGICSSYSLIPVFHAESWRIKLRTKDGEKTGWRSVDETSYHAYELGQWYP